MSRRKSEKVKFNDLWREEAECSLLVSVDPSMKTAWDNIDTGTWTGDSSEPDPQADVAKIICSACPVRRECIADAIWDRDSEGIRGGYRFQRGRVERRDSLYIFNEFGLRARTAIDRSSKVDSDAQTEEMQGVQQGE